MRTLESLLVNTGMGRDSSLSSLDLETLECDVSSGAVFVNVLRPSSEEILLHFYLGGVERRLTPEHLDDICELVDVELRQMSAKIVSHRSTLSRTCSRKGIRCLCLCVLVICSQPAWSLALSLVSHPICLQTSTLCGFLVVSRCPGEPNEVLNIS